MRRLGKVLFILAGIFLIFWRVTRRDYRETMRSHSAEVLASIDRLEILIEAGWPLELGPTDEAFHILTRWVQIRVETERYRLQIPPEFKERYDHWWGLVSQYLAEVTECIRDNNRGQASAKLSELRNKIRAFQLALRL